MKRWFNALPCRRFRLLATVSSPTIRELLCFSALLGYSKGIRIPLDSGAGKEDVSYQQFERGDAEDLDLPHCSCRDQGSRNTLRMAQRAGCAEIFEEYANGGLQIISDAMNQSGGEYPERDIQELLLELGYLNVQDIEPDVSEISF